jgi:uncharacterized protein YigE (DUF2233 family)
MKHAVVKISAFMVLLITTAVATPTHWRLIKPGIEYAQLGMLSGFHTGYVHAFRIDLTHNQIKLAVAEDQRNKIATVSDLATIFHAVIGINGGFFSQELKPLGLRISNYKERYPLKATPWWSVFYVLDNQPHIVSQREFRAIKHIQFAIQSGPRLIVNDKITRSLKPGADTRSAIGITLDHKVILAVTDHLKLTTTQLARLMRASHIEGGLGCCDAMNLDGGSSTQLYAKIDNFIVQVPSFSAVTDAILVIPN